jgi:branched-chain amino acid transport system substrate-binding protein
MKKLVLTFYFLFLIPAANAENNIGVFLPLTGSQAPWGESIQHGIELASKNCPAHFTFEDHQGKPAEASTIFESFISKNIPKAAIIFGSQTSLAIAQKAQDRKIPLISIATSDLIQKDRPYVFRHMMSSQKTGEILANEAKKEGLTKIAAVTTTHDGMIAFREGFRKAYGKDFFLSEEVAPGDTDLRALALKINRANPDSVYIVLLSPQASIFAKLMRGFGYKGKFFSANQIDLQAEIQAGGEAFENLWFTRDGNLHDSFFQQKYIAQYQKEPDNFALNGFDVATALCLAIDSKDILGYLNNLKDFHGTLGTYSMTPERAFDVPGSLWIIKKNVPELKH